MRIFRSKLISLGVDINKDGEIQESEALLITSLDLSYSNISSTEGLQYFLNLEVLNCTYNQITLLDLCPCCVYATIVDKILKLIVTKMVLSFLFKLNLN